MLTPMQMFAMALAAVMWLTTIATFGVAVLSKDPVRRENANAGMAMAFIVAVIVTAILDSSF